MYGNVHSSLGLTCLLSRIILYVTLSSELYVNMVINNK